MKAFLQNFNIKTMLIVVVAFLLGWQMGHKDLQIKWASFKPTVTITSKEPPKDINVDFKLFWDTWNLVSGAYIDKKALDPQKMFYGAISGMVSALGDPYTVFLPPTQQKISKEELNGSFEGVGIQLGFNRDKRLVVIAPLSKTPADNAGIKPEDIIVKIGDKDTANMALPEAVQLIRGPKGSKVALTIFREGFEEPKEYSLTRDTIIVKSVEVSFKQTKGGKNIAVIKLSRFGERTEEEWKSGVEEILERKADGVILDVRNNPGGYLEGAVFIASEFLSSGDAVLQENNEGIRVSFKVSGKGKLTDKPLVVLINKGSASASEIVAGALKDRKRAKLVGEKSFGKGTIQEAQDLEGGSGIHITVAKWLTPDGNWVNDTEGLEPDVVVEAPEAKEEEEADQTKDLPADPLRREASRQDPQLEKALELLE